MSAVLHRSRAVQDWEHAVDIKIGKMQLLSSLRTEAETSQGALPSRKREAAMSTRPANGTQLRRWGRTWPPRRGTSSCEPPAAGSPSRVSSLRTAAARAAAAATAMTAAAAIARVAPQLLPPTSSPPCMCGGPLLRCFLWMVDRKLTAVLVERVLAGWDGARCSWALSGSTADRQQLCTHASRFLTRFLTRLGSGRITTQAIRVQVASAHRRCRQASGKERKG